MKQIQTQDAAIAAWLFYGNGIEQCSLEKHTIVNSDRQSSALPAGPTVEFWIVWIFYMYTQECRPVALYDAHYINELTRI